MLYTDDAIVKRKNKINKIKNKLITIIYILLVPLLIYNISLILQAIINPNETPNFFGVKTYIIISGSMMPEFNVGDIVIVKNVRQDELKEGDVISFRQGQSVITHRISKKVEVDGEVQYKTKGDNNNVEDSGTISYELIEGKVTKTIPNIGKIALLLQDKIAIIVIIIMFYTYISYTGTIKNRKNQRRIKRLQYEENKEK